MKIGRTEATLRREIVEVGVRAFRAGLVTEIEGNISARLDRDRVLVSPHRLPYENRVPGDIVLLDLEGRVIRRSREPTSESRMHLAIYRAREDVGAIIHAHPVYGSAMSVAGEPIRPILDEVIPFAGGTIEVVPFAPSGSAELAEAAVRTLGKKSAVLMANHGTLCVGRDLDHAYRMTKQVEKWAQINVLAKVLGRAETIPMGRQNQQLRDYESAKTPIW